jgi:hypothetical protein
MNMLAGIISDVEWWEEFANVIANQQHRVTLLVEISRHDRVCRKAPPNGSELSQTI